MENEFEVDPSPVKKILYIGFNYDSSYFTVGTDIGFQVFQTEDCKQVFSRELNGGIGIVKILNKTNVFCLVGGGEYPRYSPNKLIIWDDTQLKEVYEHRCNNIIKNCFIKTKAIFLVCPNNIIILNMKDYNSIINIETNNNSRGLSSISNSIDKYIFAWPGFECGTIFIYDFKNLITIHDNKDNFEMKDKITIKPHENEVGIISLNYEGTRIASCSINGQTIRIFDISQQKMEREYKRGKELATILSINFSPYNDWVSLSSDKETIHIFNIKSSWYNYIKITSYKKIISFKDVPQKVLFVIDAEGKYEKLEVSEETKNLKIIEEKEFIFIENQKK